MARRLIKEEGLLCGGSSGASMHCAVQAAQDLQPGQKCVVILPDGVRNYMTKFLDDQWCADRDIIEMKEENTWWADQKVSSLELRVTKLEYIGFLRNNSVKQYWYGKQIVLALSL